MNSLTKLEHLILAVLEEAGEENIAALTNTVLKPRRGSPVELDAMIDALTHLLEAGFIETGKSRDKDSGQWVPVNKQESLAAVAGLRSDLRWSSENQLWEWQPDAPRLEILLTDQALNTTQKILREEGWPLELD